MPSIIADLTIQKPNWKTDGESWEWGTIENELATIQAWKREDGQFTCVIYRAWPEPVVFSAPVPLTDKHLFALAVSWDDKTMDLNLNGQHMRTFFRV